MKLVACFSTSESCTWSADHVFPIEYESAEQLLVDYEDEVRRACVAYDDLYGDNGRHRGSEAWKKTQVKFFGREWDVSFLCDVETKTIYPISIHTLEQWFELNKVNGK